MTTLTGSEKQVSWANDIREKLISKLNIATEMLSDTSFTDEIHPELVSAAKEILPSIMADVESQESAKWFIDHRNFDNLVEDYFSVAFEEMDEEEQERVDGFWGSVYFNI